MSELKVKHQSQFREAFNLLVESDLETLICCENYSSLRQLLQTMAYVPKFISNMKAKAKRLDTVLSPGWNASDITASEVCWIRDCQGILFPIVSLLLITFCIVKLFTVIARETSNINKNVNSSLLLLPSWSSLIQKAVHRGLGYRPGCGYNMHLPLYSLPKINRKGYRVLFY